MCTNYTSQSFRLNSVVLSNISKFSRPTVNWATVIIVHQLKAPPQPLGALRRLPHLASRSYATVPHVPYSATWDILVFAAVTHLTRPSLICGLSKYILFII